MKIKNLFSVMMAAVALVFVVCACGSDDDEPEVAVAVQVAGTYTGAEILTVNAGENSEDNESTSNYEFTKSSDIAVDMTIPAWGEGRMGFPPLPVKNITLTKSGNTITGRLARYDGTVTGADGTEKSYYVTDVTALFSGKTVVVTYTLKYGNMPFLFIGKFTGTKK